MNKNTSNSPPKTQELGGGSIMLFSLPFALVGLITLFMGVEMVKTYFEAKNWLRIPAQITKLNLKESRGDKGKRLYSIEGSYTYKIKEKEYTGNKILLENGSSSNYHEKQKIYKKLKKAQKSGKSISIFVNPNDHSDSLAIREITTGVILFTGLGSIFSSVGLFLFFLGLSQKLKYNRKIKARLLNPNKPWLADSRWNGFTISTNNKRKLFWNWAIGIFVPMFISLFVILLLRDKNAPLFAWIIVGLFATIALGLFCFAVYKTIQHLKFGESVAVLNQIPLCPGNEVRLAVLLPARFANGQKINAEFFCEKRTTTRNGKNSSTRVEKIFVQNFNQNISHSNLHRSKIALPLLFSIPTNAVPDSIDTNPSFEWKLVLKADVPGVDYLAEFPIPVFLVEDENLIQKKYS